MLEFEELNDEIVEKKLEIAIRIPIFSATTVSIRWSEICILPTQVDRCIGLPEEELMRQKEGGML